MLNLFRHYTFIIVSIFINFSIIILLVKSYKNYIGIIIFYSIYQGDRENLCSKKRNEILNRHKLFNGWFRFLGNHDEKYLENKAYTTIKFLYFRELWSDKSFKTKKSNIKKIKQTSIMKYIKSNKN